MYTVQLRRSEPWSLLCASVSRPRYPGYPRVHVIASAGFCASCLSACFDGTPGAAAIYPVVKYCFLTPFLKYDVLSTEQCATTCRPDYHVNTHCAYSIGLDLGAEALAPWRASALRGILNIQSLNELTPRIVHRALHVYPCDPMPSASVRWPVRQGTSRLTRSPQESVVSHALQESVVRREVP